MNDQSLGTLLGDIEAGARHDGGDGPGPRV